ncbi:hypothetical protein B0H19DRAFT_1236899, partial [Mycena capillaripes]
MIGRTFYHPNPEFSDMRIYAKFTSSPVSNPESTSSVLWWGIQNSSQAFVLPILIGFLKWKLIEADIAEVVFWDTLSLMESLKLKPVKAWMRKQKLVKAKITPNATTRASLEVRNSAYKQAGYTLKDVNKVLALTHDPKLPAGGQKTVKTYGAVTGGKFARCVPSPTEARVFEPDPELYLFEPLTQAQGSGRAQDRAQNFGRPATRAASWRENLLKPGLEPKPSQARVFKPEPTPTSLPAGKEIIQWENKALSLATKAMQNGEQDGSLAFEFAQENGIQRGISAMQNGEQDGSLAFEFAQKNGIQRGIPNVPEPNMRFTTVVSFLVAITAAYAGTIETRQGCPGTKVCPTNTVLQCCKGVNCIVGFHVRLSMTTGPHAKPSWCPHDISPGRCELAVIFHIHTCGEVVCKYRRRNCLGILFGVGKALPMLSH